MRAYHILRFSSWTIWNKCACYVSALHIFCKSVYHILSCQDTTLKRDYGKHVVGICAESTAEGKKKLSSIIVSGRWVQTKQLKEHTEQSTCDCLTYQGSLWSAVQAFNQLTVSAHWPKLQSAKASKPNCYSCTRLGNQLRSIWKFPKCSFILHCTF